MPVFSSIMGVVGYCIYFILPALAGSVDSEVALQDVLSEVGGGFLAESLLQTPHLNEIGLNVPVPFQTGNLMDIDSNFNLRLMNCESLK